MNNEIEIFVQQVVESHMDQRFCVRQLGILFAKSLTVILLEKRICIKFLVEFQAEGNTLQAMNIILIMFLSHPKLLQTFFFSTGVLHQNHTGEMCCLNQNCR
jgi:hypothetical protein